MWVPLSRWIADGKYRKHGEELRKSTPLLNGRMLTVEGANQLRLIAADIIHKLWKAGEATQLELLEMQAKRSVEDLKAKKQESSNVGT